MNKRALFSLLVYALSAHAQPAAAANTPTPFLPLKPAELITYMPPAPVGWNMLSSTAANDFNNGWMTSYADRSFKKIPPPPDPSVPAPPPLPVTMAVHLADTGYGTDFMTVVSPPKTGPADNTTYLKIHDFPARMVKVDATTTILDFVVKNRFLIEIRSVNLSEGDLQKIAGAFDFTNLLATPDTGETTPSNPVVLSRVDEMNPQNTRSRALYWKVTVPR